MIEKVVGMKTIAYELGVSINTVSRALRDCDNISKETKKKVRDKAIELGYLSPSALQFVKADKNQTIAFVLDGFSNLYYCIILNNLIKHLKKRNIKFTVIVSSTNHLNEDIVKQCISQRISSIISLLLIDNETIKLCKLNNILLFSAGINIADDYVDCVYVDDNIGTKILANYLVNYYCLEKIIYISIKNNRDVKRRTAFINNLKKIEKKVDVVVLDIKEIEGKLLNLINEGYYGIFCFNDGTVYQVLKYLNSIIPNIRSIYPKLHFLGYDCLNTEIDGLVDITSIGCNYDQMANELINIIIERMENPKSNRVKVEIEPILHQRVIK